MRAPTASASHCDAERFQARAGVIPASRASSDERCWNGCCPVSSSYATHAKLKTSSRRSGVSPLSTCGLAYAGVPAGMRELPPESAADAPKSTIFTSSSRVRNTLPGLKSPCTTSCSCAWSSASAHERRILFASARGSIVQSRTMRRQQPAFDQLHRHEARVAVLVQIEHAHDARMRELARLLELVMQARGGARAIAAIGPRRLQCDPKVRRRAAVAQSCRAPGTRRRCRRCRGRARE